MARRTSRDKLGVEHLLALGNVPSTDDLLMDIEEHGESLRQQLIDEALDAYFRGGDRPLAVLRGWELVRDQLRKECPSWLIEGITAELSKSAVPRQTGLFHTCHG